MPSPAEKPLPIIETFDEKEFYLDEFRGHTLLFSVPLEELEHDEDYERLAGIVHELLVNDTRVLVLVLVPDSGRGEQVLRRLQRRLGPLIFSDETIPLFAHRRPRAEAFLQLAADAFSAPESAAALLTTIWSVLRRGPLFVGVIAGVSHAEATFFAQETAARLRVYKLILIESEGGITGADGKQLSFMDEQLLATLQSAGEAEWAGLAARRATFDALRAALLGGVGSVNLCALAGAARELFTYEGSGTLFTRADYCRIERVGIDDFAEMERLIERGQREGVLKLRTPEEVADLLINACGATIGAHHLAGICGLLTQPYTAERAGEIVGLYAITRFKGEGVGGRLVARALADARAAGLGYVFACTTEERAQVFFERQGFRRVGPADVPAVKWTDYDPKRKAQVALYRFDLEAAAG
jgi:N-acetylglutamate synthase-like GNAT family acetyltransferase